MIFTLLSHLLRLLLLLVIPRPRQIPLPSLDEQEPCQACGHSPSTLRCVPSTNDPTKGVVVQRTCVTCGARRYSPTIVNAAVIHPADEGFMGDAEIERLMLK